MRVDVFAGHILASRRVTTTESAASIVPTLSHSRRNGRHRAASTCWFQDLR
jgi:hypothetical protein